MKAHPAWLICALKPGDAVLGYYSTLRCSPVFIDDASELVPLELPLGFSAWNEKSISPTRVLTCLSSCQHSPPCARKVSQRDLPNQLLNIRSHATTTNLQNSKRAILGLNNVSYAEDVLIHRFHPLHESVRLRELEVRWQCLAVGETRRQQ